MWREEQPLGRTPHARFHTASAKSGRLAEAPGAETQLLRRAAPARGGDCGSKVSQAERGRVGSASASRIGASSTAATRDEHVAQWSGSPAEADSYEALGPGDQICRNAQLQAALPRISLSDSSLERGGISRGRMGTCLAGSGRSCSSWVWLQAHNATLPVGSAQRTEAGRHLLLLSCLPCALPHPPGHRFGRARCSRPARTTCPIPYPAESASPRRRLRY